MLRSSAPSSSPSNGSSFRSMVMPDLWVVCISGSSSRVANDGGIQLVL
jgi:hypothetical protein